MGLVVLLICHTASMPVVADDDAIMDADDNAAAFTGNENTDTNEVVVADGVRFVRTSKDGGDIVNSSLTGTDLANGSLYDTDMGDEAGIEFDNDGSSGTSLTTSHQVRGSIVVTAPSSGYVFAISTGDIRCLSAGAFAEVTMSNATTATGLADVDLHAVGSNEMSYAVSGVFNVGSGSDTIELRARCSSGTGTIEVVGFTAMYFPTWY